MALEVLPRLRGYELDAVIARTPLAVVYRGRRVSPPRGVLVKFLVSLPPGLGAAARIANELNAIAALRHPNAIQVEDWGETDGVFYVVTEGEPDDSVAELLAEGARFDQRSALPLLEAVASVMDEAHLMGLTHGFLEPAVIKLTNDGMPLVVDFGLARLANASPVPGSGGVRFGGTAYVAPERAVGDPVGAAADVYAFAAIAYELLTGTAPFADPGTSAVDQLYAHVNRRPPPPSSRDQTLPPEVDAVLLRGLAKAPTERWETCGALADALGGALAPAAAPRRRRRGAAWALRLAAALALPLAAGAAILVLRSPQGANLAQHRPAGIPGGVVVAPSGQPSGAPSAAPSPTAAPTATPSPAQSVPAGLPGPLQPPGSPGPPRPGQSIRLSTTTPSRGGSLTVTGAGFVAGGTYTIDVVQRGTTYNLQPATPVGQNGTFSDKVYIPGQVLSGPATIVACGSSAGVQNCVQQAITVT